MKHRAGPPKTNEAAFHLDDEPRRVELDDPLLLCNLANETQAEGQMHYQALIDQYLAGPDLLGRAVKAMSDEQLDAKPIAGKWSTRQVVCHIVDFEPIYADRMKRVIAENCPTFFGGDPDIFAAGLAYERRPVETELELLAAVRAQMATILGQLKAEDFQRTGNHSEAGTLSLETLLQRIGDHVPHHVRFIDEKRKALGV